MKKQRELVTYNYFMDGKFQSTERKNATVYTYKDGHQEVFYVSGRRRIVRVDGEPILNIFVRRIKVLNWEQIVKQMKAKKQEG